MAKTGVAGILVLLLLLQLTPIEELEPIPQTLQLLQNSGVDLKATDVSISYSNPSDESQYKMFSSNHPIVGFDRPKDLYAVDTVNSTPMDIEVTVRNDGSTASGIIIVQLLILHNEYERFELANRTVTMNSLSSSGQGTATFYNVYVNYVQEITPWSLFLHFKASMTIRATTTSIATHTVAHLYFTCTSLVGWNAGQYWGTSTDTSVSMGQLCHIGQGQFSSYGNNLQTDLMTPIWDMSDIVANPTRTNGLSFFYTGVLSPMTE